MSSFDLSHCTQSYPSLNNESDQNCMPKKKITRKKFTPQEDDEIIKLVSIYGDENWTKISE